MVNESYVRVVALGKAGVAALGAMTDAVLDLVTDIESTCDHDSREMLEAACQEITAVSKCLRMLLLLEPANKAILDDISSARSGSKQMVRNAWMRQPYYREGERKARKQCVANLTLLPELQAAKVELKNGDVELQRCVSISKRVAVWREGLLEGSDTVNSFNDWASQTSVQKCSLSTWVVVGQGRKVARQNA